MTWKTLNRITEHRHQQQVFNSQRDKEDIAIIIEKIKGKIHGKIETRIGMN